MPDSKRIHAVLMESGIFLYKGGFIVKNISLRLVFILVGALLGGLIVYLINGEFPLGVLAGFAAGAVIILLLAVYRRKE